MAIQNTAPQVSPRRKLEISVDDKIQDEFPSLVQAYFMELNRVGEDTKNENEKQRKIRMSKYLAKLCNEFLNRYPNEIKDRNSFQDLIPQHMLRERIMADRSLFINRVPANGGVVTEGDEEKTHEDILLRERVFSEIFGIIDHAWRAMHSGMYAKDLKDLADRIQWTDRYWNNENGREKLISMGLNADAIIRDRTRSPLLFGPAEQLNPLPSLLTVNDSTDIIGAIEEANNTLDKIIGMYIQLTPLVAKKMLLCLPTLIYDQVSASGATVNMHFHTSPGEIAELFANNDLKSANRFPMASLKMKVQPQLKNNPKTKKPESNKGEKSLKGAVDAIEAYIQKLEDGEKTVSEERLNKAKKFLIILKQIYTEYSDKFEISYPEFAMKLNNAYVKAFFPNVPLPIEFIDAQSDGRFGNFMKYVNDMDKFVKFMTEHRFFDSEKELCLRLSFKKNDGSYTKFARYFWNSLTQRFEVNPEDKMDYESEIATVENGKFSSLRLQDIQDSDTFIAIPLKSIEYVSFGFGIMPEMVVLDDGVFFPAFRELPEATKTVMGGLPLYIAYNPVDPTKTGY